MPNAAQPKPKKKKRHDISNEDKKLEAPADAVIVSELPQDPSSVVNGSTRHRKGEKSKEGVTQTEPLALDKDKDEKKSKKRKRKEGAIEQTDTQLEATSNDKPEDEKKAKKRKHKEKRDTGSSSKQRDVFDEETGHVEAVTTDAEEVKEKRKKRKDKKTSAEKGDELLPGEKTELVEKTRKKRKKSESST